MKNFLSRILRRRPAAETIHRDPVHIPSGLRVWRDLGYRQPWQEHHIGLCLAEHAAGNPRAAAALAEQAVTPEHWKRILTVALIEGARRRYS